MTFKRPESVLVVVFTSAGEVLLLRRREPPDFWQSVTGSLGPDEAPLDAARRELAEETGHAGEPGATGQVNRYAILPAWRHRYAPGVTENTEHVFAMPVDAVFTPRLAGSEHVEYRWADRHEALPLVSSRTNREAIAALVPEPPTR